MHRWSHLARYALITVWEGDHPRSLAHPQHNHCGQHLQTHGNIKSLLTLLMPRSNMGLKRGKTFNLLVQFRHILKMGT